MQEKNARFLPVDCASSFSGRRLNSVAGREGNPVSAHDNDAGALASTTMQPASSQLRPQKRLSAQLADELRKPPIPSALRPAPPEQIPPDKLPDPWLFDSEKLLRELDRVREMILLIPTPTVEVYTTANNAISAIWNLRDDLRYLLSLHRDLQRSWAKKTPQMQNPKRETLRGKNTSRNAEHQEPARRKGVKARMEA